MAAVTARLAKNTAGSWSSAATRDIFAVNPGDSDSDRSARSTCSTPCSVTSRCNSPANPRARSMTGTWSRSRTGAAAPGASSCSVMGSIVAESAGAPANGCQCSDSRAASIWCG